jgi:alpha-tubulin suppressor-like RCC1 family protein
MEELRRWLPSATPVVVSGDNHSFLLEAGELYACGRNQQGQLGLGDQRDRDSWQRVVTPRTIRTVVAGLYHSFVQLETGEVYACGSNTHGQLGLGYEQSPTSYNWHRVQVPGPVRALVAGALHSLLLLETGELYACGSNDYGQLGIGNWRHRNTSGKWLPVQVPGAVRTVVAGGLNSFLLLETDEVYTCGCNSDGQLGLGDGQIRDTWQRVQVPFPGGAVREVVAGWHHSFLILESGEVYACGSSNSGQLGLGYRQKQNRLQPVQVPGVVRRVVLGSFFSLLQLETGEIYGCGDNSDGQLGLGDNDNRDTWHPIAVPGVVREVSVGWDYSLLLLETGEVYACGNNGGGQLGLGNYQTWNRWQLTSPRSGPL